MLRNAGAQASGTAFRRHSYRRESDAEKDKLAVWHMIKRLPSRAPDQIVSPRSAVLLIFVCCVTALAVLVLLVQWNIVDFNLAIFSSKAKPTGKMITARGGWRLPSLSDIRELGSDLCKIERRKVDMITLEEFERDFRYRRPLILRFDKGADSWTDAKAWTRKQLVKRHGSLDVTSGRSEAIVRSGGGGNVGSSLFEFLSKLMEERDSGQEPM